MIILKLKSILNRIYSDYFLPSRLSELKKIYQTALDKGYQLHSVASFFELIKADKVDTNQKYFINRHDIDTGKKTARKFFELEKSMNIKASYYFRLTSLDYKLMQELEEYGSEASYHFEEIAILAKKHNWKNSEDINYNLARDLFTKNFTKIKQESKLSPKIVCSHGDFVNRALKVVNHSFLDEKTRNLNKIELETYDEVFTKFITSRHSDTLYPKFYNPNNPLDAINAGEKVVYFLTHPRHWHKEICTNTQDNILRMWEGFRYKFGI